MTDRYFKSNFSMVEPFWKDKDSGTLGICILAKNTSRSIIKGETDLDKDDPLLDLLNDNKWLLPNHFIKGIDCMDPINESLMELIRESVKAVSDFLRAHVYLVETLYYDVLAAFVVSTYFDEEQRIFPRVAILGDTNSGKSRLMGVIQTLSYRGFKFGNISFAAGFRIIDKYGCTVILEETHNYSNASDIKLLYRDGFDKKSPIAKCNPSTLETEIFDCHSPMIVSTRTTKFIEDDVENRSIIIKMKPTADKRYIERYDEEKESDELRTKLYHMKYVYAVQKNYFSGERVDQPHFDLKEHCRDCSNELIDGTDKVFSNIGKRANSIASALYPYMKIADTQNSLFQMLQSQEEKNRSRQKLSDLGEVFNVLTDLAREKSNNVLSKTQFRANIAKIPTVAIRERIVTNRIDEGNLIRDTDNIKTQDIRFPLKDMGFELDFKHKTAGKTYIVESPGFKEIFDANMETYGLKDVSEWYASLPEVEEIKETKGEEPDE